MGMSPDATLRQHRYSVTHLDQHVDMLRHDLASLGGAPALGAGGVQSPEQAAGRNKNKALLLYSGLLDLWPGLRADYWTTA